VTSILSLNARVGALKPLNKTCWRGLTDVANQFIGIGEEPVSTGFYRVEPHILNVPATLNVRQFVDERLPARCISDAGIRNKNQTTRLGALKQKACFCSNCKDGVHTFSLDLGRLSTNVRRNDQGVITEMNPHDYDLDQMKTGGALSGNWLSLPFSGGICRHSNLS
jgi:hypothetical protein